MKQENQRLPVVTLEDIKRVKLRGVAEKRQHATIMKVSLMHGECKNRVLCTVNVRIESYAQ